MRNIQEDESGNILGFVCGCIIYVFLISIMIIFPVSWAFFGLVNATTIGAGIAYVIALIIFIIITILIAIFGTVFPIIGAVIE